MIKQSLYTIVLTTAIMHAAAELNRAVILADGPVKASIPTTFVSETFQQMLAKGVADATELNNDTAPTGDINVPYQAISKIGYPAYVQENPDMIDDSVPFILSVNNDPLVQFTWQTVVAAKSKQLSARKKALEIYWDVANIPLAQEEKQFIPDLKLAPNMVAIMLANQTLTLNPEQKKVWNAIFASSASILNAMNTQDHEAFALLFKQDIPGGSCSIQ